MVSAVNAFMKAGQEMAQGLPEGYHYTLGDIVTGRMSDAKAANLAWQRESAFNSAEAQKQRDFEERMANTSYQRAASDLQALGFNPAALVMGNSQPASTPSGSSASAHYNKASGGSLADIIKAVMTAAVSAFGVGSRAATALTIANNSNATKRAIAGASTLIRSGKGYTYITRH